jgi:hypothetical protein
MKVLYLSASEMREATYTSWYLPGSSHEIIRFRDLELFACHYDGCDGPLLTVGYKS